MYNYCTIPNRGVPPFKPGKCPPHLPGYSTGNILCTVFIAARENTAYLNIVISYIANYINTSNQLSNAIDISALVRGANIGRPSFSPFAGGGL